MSHEVHNKARLTHGDETPDVLGLDEVYLRHIDPALLIQDGGSVIELPTMSNTEVRTAVEAAADSNVFTDADHVKLDGAEDGATADQTDAEIRTAVEAASDSNVFTDADHSKLDAIEASATADQTDAEIRTAVGAASDSNVLTDALKTKLDGIETSATADQTDAEIRTAVEAASDSNVFTDADHSKLDAIEAAADVTDATNVAAANALMKSGGTMTGKITLDADPTAALHAATKQYADALSAGLDPKAAADLATTANVTLSGEQTIDGILTSTSRILVKDQSTGSENGVYITAAGAWSRATDADEDTEVTSGFYLRVISGTANGKKGFIITTTGAIVVGTTAVTFELFSDSTSAPVDSVNSKTGAVVIDPDDLDDSGTTKKFTTAGDISKLAAIEASATTDQTDAEIRTAVEAASDSNVFTDADHSKLDGIAASAIANVVADTSPQLGADLDLNEFNIGHIAAPSADHKASGNTISLTAGEALVFGQPCYIKSDGKAWKADADGAAPAERGVVIAIATIAADAAGLFAMPNTILRDDSWTWTVGNPIYLSATAGALTQTAPSVARVMGIATHADRMFFFPSTQDSAGGGGTITALFFADGTATQVRGGYLDAGTVQIYSKVELNAGAEAAVTGVILPPTMTSLDKVSVFGWKQGTTPALDFGIALLAHDEAMYGTVESDEDVAGSTVDGGVSSSGFGDLYEYEITDLATAWAAGDTMWIEVHYPSGSSGAADIFMASVEWS